VCLNLYGVHALPCPDSMHGAAQRYNVVSCCPACKDRLTGRLPRFPLGTHQCTMILLILATPCVHGPRQLTSAALARSRAAIEGPRTPSASIAARQITTFCSTPGGSATSPYFSSLHTRLLLFVLIACSLSLAAAAATLRAARLASSRCCPRSCSLCMAAGVCSSSPSTAGHHHL
jgi:hypothetical protein